MEIKLKPSLNNSYPLGGFIIKGDNPALWAKEIQQLQLSLNSFEAFPIPHNKPNTIWACLVVTKKLNLIENIGKNEYCQVFGEKLFLPEHCKLTPAITNQECDQLLSSTRNFFHPEVGLVELKNEINWLELILDPEIKLTNSQCPSEINYIPKRIRSFQLISIPAEEVLKNFKLKNFPEHQDINEDKLSIYEKSKYHFYKLFFKSVKDPDDPNQEISKPTNFINKINSFLNTDNKYIEKMKNDFDSLQKRNQKQFDKLMDLFKNNPYEALKYAMPLDENGVVRGGGESAEFSQGILWHNFSLFGKTPSGNGGSVNLGNNFYKLKEQYRKTAEDFIKKNDFHQAAFIYMRLLKDFNSAAETLEKGGFHIEAASIYLKHAKDKNKAALCYENGNYFQKAIELYKELNNFEKVGDLNVKLGKIEEANLFYEKVIETYKTQNQFIKASLIYKNKMNSPMKSQNLLLEGWRTNKDSFNCLNNYFQNLENSNQLMNEINNIYQADVTVENRKSFLNVIKLEYRKKNEFKNEIRNIAYEIISQEIKTSPELISELIFFNEKDSEFLKDTIRYTSNRKRQKT